ncbi:MAG: CHRD domain-containing protein [Nocardioidaceae bacterium]
MRTTLRALVPLAAAALPFAVLATPAQAADDSSYQTTLNPLNNSNGSGMATVTVSGDQAQVKVSWSGLAETFGGGAYPHVQHIHIAGNGQCPTAADDKDGDGVVSTTEGAPAYGGIGTTLSTKGDTSPAAGTNIKIAPSGGSLDYSRSIKLSSDTVDALQAGTGVIVVHGLDPSTLSKKAQNAKSDLVPSLPLAATSPALCGVLSSMPSGGVATGTGTTSGVEDLGTLALGGGLLALGGTALIARRRAVAGR